MKRFLSLGLLGFACACSTISQNQINATDLSASNRPDAPVAASGTFVQKLDTKQETLEADFLTASDGDTTLSETQRYAKGRRTQINDLCKIYFDELDSLFQTQRFLRDELSLGFDVAAAAMGLTGAAAKQLALLALGDAAINGTAENLERFYLLTPTPTKVYELVRKEQAAFLTKRKLSEVKDYLDAKDYVREYATICTPERIRSTVDKAIASKDVSVDEPLTTDAQLQASLKRLETLFNRAKADEATTDAAPEVADGAADKSAGTEKAAEPFITN